MSSGVSLPEPALAHGSPYVVDCDHRRLYPFAPERTALLCIDFQRDFIEADGFCASRGLPVHNLAAILPAARSLLRWARRSGLSIFHTREEYRPDLCDLNRYRACQDSAVGEAGPLGRYLVRGEAGTAIVEEMKPEEHEPVLAKSGFSAFHGTSLYARLEARGITHLILAGVTTQCCVSSTLRSAVDLGYFPLLATDGCAAFYPADHAGSISVIASENHALGWTSSVQRILKAHRA